MGPIGLPSLFFSSKSTLFHLSIIKWSSFEIWLLVNSLIYSTFLNLGECYIVVTPFIYLFLVFKGLFTIFVNYYCILLRLMLWLLFPIEGSFKGFRLPEVSSIMEGISILFIEPDIFCIFRDCYKL